jgi:hypothetical protein
MTHKQLTRRMAAWLKFRKQCSVVATDLHTAVSETPDAIGFYGTGGSILIECKVSRADFLADKAKQFRQFEDNGMGDFRYFATLPDMVKPTEVPEGWGLLEVRERRVMEIVEPVLKPSNKRNEVKVLMSILRRLEISTAVFVRQDIGDELAA